MVTESTIYWITRLDALKTLTLITGTLCIGVILIGFLAYCLNCKGGNEKKVLYWCPIFILPLILFIGSVFIPTTKEMCAIKAIPVVVNNKQVQEMPNKVLELANEWIDELKPNKESK